ncbi:MAG: hypothetical protein Q7S98_05715 [Deltaproteobacteria bacterium]|nr:hypothetical protein [Deltaproteobacteria bacterium]
MGSENNSIGFCRIDPALQMSLCEPIPSAQPAEESIEPTLSSETDSYTTVVSHHDNSPILPPLEDEVEPELTGIDLPLVARPLLLFAETAYRAGDFGEASIYYGRAGEAFGLLGDKETAFNCFEEAVHVLGEAGLEKDDPQILYARAELAAFRAIDASERGELLDLQNAESAAMEDYLSLYRQVRDREDMTDPSTKQMLLTEFSAKIQATINRALLSDRLPDATLYLGMWHEVEPSQSSARQLLQLYSITGRFDYRGEVKEVEVELAKLQARKIELNREPRVPVAYIEASFAAGYATFDAMRRAELQREFEKVDRRQKELILKQKKLLKSGAQLRNEIRSIVETGWGKIPEEDPRYFERELVIARTYEVMDEVAAANEVLGRLRDQISSHGTIDSEESLIRLTHEIALNEKENPKEAAREAEVGFQMAYHFPDPARRKYLLAQSMTVGATLSERRGKIQEAEAKLEALAGFYEAQATAETTPSEKLFQKEAALGALVKVNFGVDRLIHALRTDDDEEKYSLEYYLLEEQVGRMEAQFGDFPEFLSQARLAIGEAIFESGKPVDGLNYIRDHVQRKYPETLTAASTRRPTFRSWQLRDDQARPILVDASGNIKQNFNARGVKEWAKNVVVHSGHNNRWLTMGLVGAGSGLGLLISGGAAAPAVPVYVSTVLGGLGGLAADKAISVATHWDQVSQGWQAGMSPASMQQLYDEMILTGIQAGSLFVAGAAGTIAETATMNIASQGVRSLATAVSPGVARLLVPLTRLVPPSLRILGADGQVTWGEMLAREMLARPVNAIVMNGVMQALPGQDENHFWQSSFETWLFIRAFAIGQDLRLSAKILPTPKEPVGLANRQAYKATSWMVDTLTGSFFHTGFLAAADLAGMAEMHGSVGEQIWQDSFGFIPIHLGNRFGNFLFGRVAPPSTRGILKDVARETYRNFRAGEAEVRTKAGFNRPEVVLAAFAAREIGLTANATDQMDRLASENSLPEIMALFRGLNGKSLLTWRELHLLSQAIMNGAAARMIHTEREGVRKLVEEAWQRRDQEGALDRELGFDSLDVTEAAKRREARKVLLERRLTQTLGRMERLMVELVGDFLYRQDLTPMSDAEMRQKIRGVLYEGTIHPTQISRMELYRIERNFVVLLRLYGRICRYLAEGNQVAVDNIQARANLSATHLRELVQNLVMKVAIEATHELTPKGLQFGSAFLDASSQAQTLTRGLAEIQEGKPSAPDRERVRTLIAEVTDGFVQMPDGHVSDEVGEIVERASYELVTVRNHSEAAGRLPHQVAFWIDFDAASRPASLGLHVFTTLLIKDIERKVSLAKGLPEEKRPPLDDWESKVEACRRTEVQLAMAESLRRNLHPEPDSPVARLLDELLPEEIIRDRYLSQLAELRRVDQSLRTGLVAAGVTRARYNDLSPLVSYIPRFDHASAEVPYVGPAAMTPEQRARFVQMKEILATARLLVSSGGKALVPKVILCNTEGSADIRRIIDFVDGEPALDQVAVVPLFEDRESVKRVPKVLRELWTELGPERFRQRINEVFIAGSDLSRVVSWPVALRLFLEAAHEVADFNRAHGTDIILKMGSGEALQRQNGMPDPFGGEPLWVETPTAGPTATSAQSPYWGVHSLLQLFPKNVRLITMQTRGHEVMIQVMTPEQARTFQLRELQAHLGEENRFGENIPPEFSRFSRILEEGGQYEEA